jgi:glycerol-3-phosphate dehydrogenase
LARRTRALLLNAKASIAMAPAVARVMADELDRGDDWVASQIAEYTTLATGYMLPA